MGENGSYENVVRPITRQVMDWAETQFGKPATSEHKWAMIGTPLLHPILYSERYENSSLMYGETVLCIIYNLFTVYI